MISVSETLRRRTRKVRQSIPQPVVSEHTRARLYREAEVHPAFDGMEPGQIRAYIDKRLELFISKQPWWYGHFDDTRIHAAKRQYAARRGKDRAGPLNPTKGFTSTAAGEAAEKQTAGLPKIEPMCSSTHEEESELVAA
jgi:hypothetical protein